MGLYKDNISAGLYEAMSYIMQTSGSLKKKKLYSFTENLKWSAVFNEQEKYQPIMWVIQYRGS